MAWLDGDLIGGEVEMNARNQQENNASSYADPLAGFRSTKAAQLSAFFALQSEGQIEKLKLIKLIYLAERRSLKEYEQPMLFDEFYSLPHGPICSSTLNGIDGIIHDDMWSKYIYRNENEIVPTKRFTRDDLDELSNVEISIATKIWRRFGKLTAPQIRNYFHKKCPEYTEIERGRLPISYRSVLEALANPYAEDIDREIAALRRAESILAVRSLPKMQRG